jgi:hypothetical protein
MNIDFAFQQLQILFFGGGGGCYGSGFCRIIAILPDPDPYLGHANPDLDPNLGPPFLK